LQGRTVRCVHFGGMIAQTANLAAGSGVVKQGIANGSEAWIIKATAEVPKFEMTRWEQIENAGCLTQRLSGKRRRARSFKLPAYGNAE
jgi:hypothetical protein